MYYSSSPKFSDTNATVYLSATGEITTALVIVIVMLFTVALILYLHSKGYLGAIGSFNSRSHDVVFAPSHLKKPLDPIILNSLPVSIFRSKDVKEMSVVECAVCLSELTDGEKARFLPKCKHSFHVECIDMWFHSNSTCPLCRNLVGVDDGTKLITEIPELENGQDFKLNFDVGSSSLGSSFSEQGGNGMLILEIPRFTADGLSSLFNRIPTEGITSPALDRLRSVRRILSRGNLNTDSCVSSTCSPRGSDIEQGGMQGTQSVSETGGYQV